MTIFFFKIPSSSILYKMLLRNKRKKSKDQGQIVFKLKEIGEVIQELLSSLFQHSFTKKPISTINTSMTIKALEQTVNFSESVFSYVIL